MVNGVGFTGSYSNFAQYSYKDLENVAKYTLGTTIVGDEESPFTGMGLMIGLGALPELWKGGKWLFSEKARKGKTVSEGWAEGKELFNKSVEAQKTLLGNGNWAKLDTYKTVWNNYSLETTKKGIPTGEEFENLSKEAQAHYNKAKEAIETASKNPKQAREYIKIADEAVAKGNALSLAEKAAPKTFWGKAGKVLKTATGYEKAKGFLIKTAPESKVASKILKYGKGNGLFLAIEGIMALFTIVPTFTQLGAGSGMKQIGKSVAKSGASIGGWVAGAAAGAAIGSIIPGAGTIIGGAIGALCSMVGGCIGSWAAKKGAEAIVGKDELELAKEKQAQQLAAEASQSPEAAQQLVAAAKEKLQAEGAESEDAKVAFGSLTRLAQNQPLNNETQYAQNQTSFTGTGKQTTNPYKINPKAFSQVDFMDQDFMAMDAGLA